MMLFEYALSLSSAVLPKLQVQQVFHAAGWLAVLTWLSVQFIRMYNKQWRWLIASFGWLLVLLLVVVMEENDVTTMMMTIGSGHSPCREMLPEAVGTYTLGPRAPACKALNVSDIPLATSS